MSEEQSSGCGGCGTHGPSGCGGSCGGGCGGGIPQSSNPLEVTISPPEEAFLQKLAQCPFLPVARFLFRAKNPEAQEHMSLEPVFLETGEEDFPLIKGNAHVILSLLQKNIVSVDYDSPLEGSDPAVYTKALGILQDAVSQNGEEFLPPELVQGSVCLTAVGDLVIEQLDFT